MQTESFSPEFPVSEIELIYKSKVKPSERVSIRHSDEAYALFLAVWDKNKIDFIEEFKVLFLNRAGSVLGVYNAFTGGITGTPADVRIIFAAALKLNACSIIVCHNHPSGNLIPSVNDEHTTQLLKEAGEILNIKLNDHLIISCEGYYSFLNERAI